jgi:hypothetical protein
VAVAEEGEVELVVALAAAALPPVAERAWAAGEWAEPVWAEAAWEVPG